MSKHQVVRNIRFAACAAIIIGGLTLPASAQHPGAPRIVPEKHFTIPPDVPTAVVLQAEPDAACDLHAAGVNDPSHTMRLYGNIEGYVRFHFTPNQDIQDAYLQIDCTTSAAVTTHAVHLRIAETPTADMPTPESVIPAPKGSKVRPALTDEAARLLSDEEVIAQGYPPRPDSIESPDAYAAWLEHVSRPMTILPPHWVSRTDISHSTLGVTEGTSANNIWSGFVATGLKDSYGSIDGSWRVPFVSADPSGQPCYSSVWVGLDGYGLSDLVQAGTEQDAQYIYPFGTATNYYLWTEVLPNQPTAVEIFGVNSSDLMYVNLWVGDSTGKINPSGGYAWFSINDSTAGQGFHSSTPLGKGFGFKGSTAEWIVERPTISGSLPDFANYGAFGMVNAYVFPPGGKAIAYSKVANVQVTMREQNTPYPDNDVLSTASSATGHADWINFFWKNFH